MLEMLLEMHEGLRVKRPLFLPDINENSNVSAIFCDAPQYQILLKSI
jgi:hypothetical protein